MPIMTKSFNSTGARRSLHSALMFAAVSILLILSLFASLSFGAANISFADVFNTLLPGWGEEVSDVKQRILLELRAPRTLLALLAGVGLSLAGAVLQNVTRNPLADPYLFGISSGASFGAVCVIAGLIGGVGVLNEFAQLGITAGAFIGSALSVVIVVALAGQGKQIERMLLAGVATSFMFSALTSLVLYVSDPLAASSLLFWSLGSFTRATWSTLMLPLIVILICLFVFIGQARAQVAMLAGDESARSLGVDVERLRLRLLLLSSLLTATLVASCGGVGFVGLMIPHITRRLVRARGRQFLVSVCILGGVFMIWVDILARTLMDGVELPVGVITAAIGSIFFLVLMRRKGMQD